MMSLEGFLEINIIVIARRRFSAEAISVLVLEIASPLSGARNDGSE